MDNEIKLQMKVVALERQVADLNRAVSFLRTAARNALIDLDDDDTDAVREALESIAGRD